MQGHAHISAASDSDGGPVRQECSLWGMDGATKLEESSLLGRCADLPRLGCSWLRSCTPVSFCGTSVSFFVCFCTQVFGL